VDKAGNLYAVNWGFDRNAVGRVDGTSLACGPAPGAAAAARAAGGRLNGLRALPDGSFLGAAPEARKVVLLTAAGAARDFCSDPRMVGPNDLAVSPKTGYVYVSGQAWTGDTQPGDGDVWLCRRAGEAPVRCGGGAGGAAAAAGVGGSLQPLRLPLAARTWTRSCAADRQQHHLCPSLPLWSDPRPNQRLAQLGRTNGIEVTSDGGSLLVSEAFNKGGTPVRNLIWRYPIASDGTIKASDRALVIDFASDGTGHVDVDGMRLDAGGRLFVARNGGGEVVVVDPMATNKILQRIKVGRLLAGSGVSPAAAGRALPPPPAHQAGARANRAPAGAHLPPRAPPLYLLPPKGALQRAGEP
jgi:hypothetical protein